MNKVLGIMILTGYASFVIVPNRTVAGSIIDALVVGLSAALFMGIGW